MSPKDGCLTKGAKARDGRAFADSRDVAQAFGKEHRHLLRSIQELECLAEFNRLNLERVFYVVRNGETFTSAYVLTR
jgi:Rha family phage regulatory protein